MTREELQKLFDLGVPLCSEVVEWASKQEDQSVEGLLAACKRRTWREFVARNSRSAVVLERLAEDKDWEVRFGVASNPNTPAAVLEGLVGDESLWVRVGLASNPSTPAAVLEVLAKDGNGWVQSGVASNPNTPAAVLERLA